MAEKKINVFCSKCGKLFKGTEGKTLCHKCYTEVFLSEPVREGCFGCFGKDGGDEDYDFHYDG